MALELRKLRKVETKAAPILVRALGTVVPKDKSEKTETSYFRKNNSADTQQGTRFKLGSSSWA